MNNIFNHLLSDEEAALVEQSHRQVYGAESVESEVASEFEEQLWFEHQQQSLGEGQLMAAWRLEGAVDYGRLVNALQQAQQRLPGANVGYVYDDDCGLVCRKNLLSQQPVTLQAIHHQQEAIDALLHAKETPFDLAQTPPLRFMLFPSGQYGVLGIVVHRILSGSVDWRDVLNSVAALYNQQPAGKQPKRVAARPLPLLDSSALKGLLRGETLVDCAGTTDAGVHLCISLPKALIDSLALANGNDISLLAGCAALFAQTLGVMVGDRQVALYLPESLGQDAAIEPAVTKLVLECGGKSVTELTAEIQQHLRGESPLPTPTQALVPLRVLWRYDRVEALHLQQVALAPLAVPPGHTAWPLTAIVSGDGQVDIIAGAQLAGWVGEFLLMQSLHPQVNASVAVACQAPAVPVADVAIQQHILAAFREALAMPAMGENDDFFDFGGHSLTATRIIGRLKNQHHIELNINDLFSYPSAAQLARYARIDQGQAASSAWQEDGLASVCPQAPLSLAQKSLWKIYQALGCSEAFNIPFALRFIDLIDEGIFFQAFQDILLRHPGLRTLFVDIAGEVYQQVIPPEMLSQYEWFRHSPPQQDIPLSQALTQAASHHFELDSELPVRITFLKDEENGQQVVSLLFHHIVLDEWSVNILMDEFAQAVASRSAGNIPIWQQTPAPFHAFAIRQQKAGLNHQSLQFWLDRLRGAPPAAPIFSTVAEKADAEDPRGGWVELKLEPRVSDGLYRLAKQQGASLFNVVYAGIAAALHLLGGSKELVIGTSASGRNDAQFFDTIGYFTTVVAHRIAFDNALTLNALIDDVKRQINDSMPYTDIPIDLVEERLFGDHAVADRHMFEVFIQIHAKNKLNGALVLADGSQIRFRQVDPEKVESVLGLQFEVMEEAIEGEPSVRIMMSYRTDHYSSAQVRRIVQTTQQLFAVMARSVGKTAVRLDALRALSEISP